MKRFNLSIRRRTITEQSVSCDLKEKICNFVDFNEKQINVHNFYPSMIANMDKTSIWADMPSTTTIEQRGTRTTPIHATGHEKTASLCACVFKQTEQN